MEKIWELLHQLYYPIISRKRENWEFLNQLYHPIYLLKKRTWRIWSFLTVTFSNVSSKKTRNGGTVTVAILNKKKEPRDGLVGERPRRSKALGELFAQPDVDLVKSGSRSGQRECRAFTYGAFLKWGYPEIILISRWDVSKKSTDINKIKQIRWSLQYAGFHRWGYPIAGWFMENPSVKWMIWGYPYFRKPPYIFKVISKKKMEN